MNTIALARPQDGAQPGERDIARLLARRYGDGTVYVPSVEGMGLFHICMALGFVSTDGVRYEQGPPALDPPYRLSPEPSGFRMKRQERSGTAHSVPSARVCGGNGNDVMQAAEGADVLMGGPGRDRCRAGEQRTSC